MAVDATAAPVVVKVGGSLFDLPDLGPRLTHWLGQLAVQPILLVPGGGPAANVVRDLDRRHDLGEERSHWLALSAMSLNAQFLTALLPSAAVAGSLEECAALWRCGAVPVLDAHAFARADEGRPGSLPHSWDVTSDAVAARVAQVTGAVRLILLKSVDIPPGIDWAEAGRRGLVDGWFASVARYGLEVEAVNLRKWH